MDLAELVPGDLAGWRINGEDGLYDRETVFRYMNGAAEIYLSFDFRRLFVRRLAGDGDAEITVELYDMGCPADAFGVFSRNRQGRDVGIGQGSEYRSGHLMFWKGRYFVTVFAVRETEGVKNAVLELGGAIAARIRDEGPKPSILSLLPREDLVETSIRYFHKHTDLNEHYFVADDNILDLDSDTDAVFADYERGQSRISLLAIRYPSTTRAASAHESYVEAFLPEAEDTGVTRIEDGSWTAAARSGVYVLAVYDAPQPEDARRLLTGAEQRIQEVGE
jgi:hypothetical protein